MPRIAKPYPHRGYYVTNVGPVRYKLCRLEDGPAAAEEAFLERRRTGGRGYPNLEVAELVALPGVPGPSAAQHRRPVPPGPAGLAVHVGPARRGPQADVAAGGLDEQPAGHLPAQVHPHGEGAAAPDHPVARVHRCPPSSPPEAARLPALLLPRQRGQAVDEGRLRPADGVSASACRDRPRRERRVAGAVLQQPYLTSRRRRPPRAPPGRFCKTWPGTPTRPRRSGTPTSPTARSRRPVSGGRFLAAPQARARRPFVRSWRPPTAR